MMSAFGKTRQGGFTLIELVVAMSITALLVAGLSSAIMIATKAIPKPGGDTTVRVNSADIFDQIASELSAAVHITEQTANAITLTIADRNADGVLERIRYAWSGIAGDPLTRQFNNGLAVTIISQVQQFTLNYQTRSVTEQYPSPPVEGPEVTLASFNPATGVFTWQIDSFDHTAGQYVQPVMPVDAISWRVSRYQLVAAKDGAKDGQVRVQIRLPETRSVPSTTILDDHLLSETSLTSSLSWYSFTATNMPSMLPGEGLHLLFQYVSGVSAMTYAYGPGGPDHFWWDSFTSEWIGEPAKSMRYTLYGYIMTAPPPQSITRQYVTSVGMSINAGASIDTSVQALNQPEVLSNIYELNFNADPRVVDLSGNGGDWVDYTNVLNPVNISGGIWYAPNNVSGGIMTAPAENFAVPTTVDLRYKATSVGGWGAAFWINADRHSGSTASLIANLYKPDATSQQLWIGHELANGTIAWLKTYSVPDDFVDVRLVIDPVADTMAVFTDGEHKDTFNYFWGSPATGTKAWVYTEGVTAEFDYVRIRVGGTSP